MFFYNKVINIHNYTGFFCIGVSMDCPNMCFCPAATPITQRTINMIVAPTILVFPKAVNGSPPNVKAKEPAVVFW
jgi:hypothetical protein